MKLSRHSILAFILIILLSSSLLARKEIAVSYGKEFQSYVDDMRLNTFDIGGDLSLYSMYNKSIGNFHSTGRHDRNWMAITSGDFDVDGDDEIAAAFIDLYYNFNLKIGDIADNYQIAPHSTNKILENQGGLAGLSLASGDFNGNGKDNLVLGYTATLGQFIMTLEVSSNLETITIKHIKPVLSFTTSSAAKEDVATGDVDGDGKDEVIIMALDEEIIAIAVYDVSSALQLTLKCYKEITGGYSNQYYIAVTTGDFNNDGKDEIAIAWRLSGETDLYLRTYEIINNNMFTRDTHHDDYVGGECRLDLATGDFDRDGTPELVNIWEGGYNKLYVKVYDIDANLQIIPKIKKTDELCGGHSNEQYLRVFTGNFRENDKDQIVIAWEGYGYDINVKIYNVSDDLSTLYSKGKYTGEDMRWTISLTSGSFSRRPGPPYNLTLQGLDPYTVRVSWDKAIRGIPSYPFTGYKIYRSDESSSGPFYLVKTINNPNLITWDNDGLIPDHRYWYKIKAFNDKGESKPTKVKWVRTPLTNLKAYNADGTEYPLIRWYWTGPSPQWVYPYIIYRDGDVCGYDYNEPWAWQEEWKLDPGETRYYQVKVWDTELQQYIWSNVVPVHNPEPGDPIVGASADTSATAYSNSRKIIVDNNYGIHATYTSNDTVYYVYSDDGETFSKPFPVGNGRYPGIALDGNEVPHLCWIKKMDTKQYSIYHSELTQFGWTPPKQLLLEYKKTCTPTSFDIDKDDNIAHLSWADFQPSEKWVIYRGSFSLLDTTPQIVPIPYDSAFQMTPESPNYLCDQTGLVDGYLLWEKEDNVYAAIEVNGVVKDIKNISNSPNPSIHPNLSMWGDSLYAVWQEYSPWGSKVYFSSQNKNYFGEWSRGKEIIGFPDNAVFPVCVGPIVVFSAKNKTSNYNIYAFMSEEFGDILHSYGCYNSKYASRFPSIFYKQSFPNPTLYVFFTDDTSSSSKGRIEPVIAEMKVKLMPPPAPIPKINVNLGLPYSSPYTIQRDKFISFGAGNLAFQTADLGKNELKYKIQNLNIQKRYKIKLICYFELKKPIVTGKPWRFKVKVNNHPLGNIIIRPKEKKTFEKWIPPKFYQSGELDVSITKKEGDFVVCSEIFLIDYTTKKIRTASGSHLSEENLRYPKIKFRLAAPNPFSNKTYISAIINKESNFYIKVYDLTGRKIKTIINKQILQKGKHTFSWNGRNDQNREVPDGVYFIVMGAEKRKIIRKIVKLK